MYFGNSIDGNKKPAASAQEQSQPKYVHSDGVRACQRRKTSREDRDNRKDKLAVVRKSEDRTVPLLQISTKGYFISIDRP